MGPIVPQMGVSEIPSYPVGNEIFPIFQSTEQTCNIVIQRSIICNIQY